MTIECQNPPYDDFNILQLIDDTMGREQFDRSNQGNNNVTVNVNTQQHSGSGDNIGRVGRDRNTFNNI